MTRQEYYKVWRSVRTTLNRGGHMRLVKHCYPGFIESIENGFIEALIWQDETLDHYSGSDLSYNASEKIAQTIKTFIFICATNDQAMSEIIDHGFSNTGHDLALQIMGHGVGFWEQDQTKTLDTIVNQILEFKVIKPFELFFDDASKKLEIEY